MIGTRLGAYEILAELGSGGMGTVYRAKATRSVAGLAADCPVALKVIHAHLLETEGFFQRFLREADIGRSVQHENVVRTYVADAILHEGVQQNFLVMEYVEGQTLRALLEELERVPEELCRHIGREVAKGLAAIHAAGVVHRDIKPENVLITPDHVVKVMDLGVARLQDEAIRLSQTGVFVGSLEYGAPEQFRSADGEPDGRADLHALGTILYELSTGRHPFRNADAARTLHGILHEEPRPVGAVNPQLSPFFEEVVNTLLQKDREQRFAQAVALAEVFDVGEESRWWKERAAALRVETKRPLRRIRVPRETALYGRDDDLALLGSLYERAKDGDGQVLLIEGEAGIGKTRLVDEFVGRLRREGEDVNFLFGSYPPGGAATSSGAFSTAYREHFGEEGLESTLSEYLKATPVLIPAFAALLRGETTPAGAEALTKDSVQTVFVHATRSLAAERTTILLIDDLHFAPDDGRALFSSLAMAVPEHRILLVGTMRPGVPEDWIANVERLDQAERRSLHRLGAKDLGKLLIDAFRSERLATELGLQIATKSDGNPFFTFEIIRGLKEGLFIGQEPDGTWITTKVIEDIQVPSSVLDLVNARVADLSEHERDVLDVASCCGFDFDPLLLGDIVGLSRIALLKTLGQIERRYRLVRAVGRRFAFDHHQVQEALYGSLSELLKEEYHASIGHALEARLGAAADFPGGQDCVELCTHFLRGAQGKRALPYLRPALDHLGGAYLPGQAIQLADQALARAELLEGDARVEILVRKGYQLAFLGRREAQQEALDEAGALVDETTDTLTLARLDRARGTFHLAGGDFEQALVHMTRTLDLARRLQDRKHEAGAHGVLGVVKRSLSRFTEAEAHHEEQLEIAREIGDLEETGAATTNLGIVYFSLDRLDASIDHLERGLALFHESGNRRSEANALAALAGAIMSSGRYVEAEPYLARSLDSYRAIGFRRGEGTTTGNLGILCLSLGRYEDALRHTQRSIAISRETGNRLGETNGLVNLGPIWLWLGQRERAREALTLALQHARQIGARSQEGYALAGLASVADEEGDRERALVLAEEALTLRRSIGPGGVAQSLVQVGRLHHVGGDPDKARACIEEAVALCREQHTKEEIVIALALLAGLPGGDVEAAQASFQEAGDPADRPDVRFHLWKATGKREHLTGAKRCLDYRIEHAPEEFRVSMLANVRLHRDIMAAWANEGDAT